VVNPTNGKVPAPDSEAAFISWIESTPITSGECSMFKEDVVEVGASNFFRTVLKTNCDKPVGYAVAMNSDDWGINMEHAYPEMEMLGCIVTPENDEIIECLIRATP